MRNVEKIEFRRDKHGLDDDKVQAQSQMHFPLHRNHVRVPCGSHNPMQPMLCATRDREQVRLAKSLFSQRTPTITEGVQRERLTSATRPQTLVLRHSSNDFEARELRFVIWSNQQYIIQTPSQHMRTQILDTIQ